LGTTYLLVFSHKPEIQSRLNSNSSACATPEDQQYSGFVKKARGLPLEFSDAGVNSGSKVSWFERTVSGRGREAWQEATSLRSGNYLTKLNCRQLSEAGFASATTLTEKMYAKPLGICVSDRCTADSQLLIAPSAPPETVRVQWRAKN